MSEKKKRTITDLWFDEYMHKDRGLCGLCGNSGIIDTRGHMYSAAGVECGILAFCICPNGRTWRKEGANLEYLARIRKEGMRHGT